MQDELDALVEEMRQVEDKGIAADYIPELSDVSTNLFGIAICTADGREFASGDCDHKFTIQSISKVFSLGLALGRSGDQLWTRVGKEPSGKSFDSISLLEQEGGRPRNPFINAGALVVVDEILAGRTQQMVLMSLVAWIRPQTKLALTHQIRSHVRTALCQASSCGSMPLRRRAFQ